MIDRYVFVKLTDDYATLAGRDEVVKHTHNVLRGLPGVVALTVGTPADERCEAMWDISIVVRFANLEDVETYRVHPTHRSYVDDFLRPKMAAIKAWNFVV